MPLAISSVWRKPELQRLKPHAKPERVQEEVPIEACLPALTAAKRDVRSVSVPDSLGVAVERSVAVVAGRRATPPPAARLHLRSPLELQARQVPTGTRREV